MKILKLTGLFFLLTNILGCSAKEISPIAPTPQEDSIFADILVKKDGGKFTAQFMFYRSISEIVNGRENKGFGKSPLIVDFPKIDGKEMLEKKVDEIQKVYLAEIENIEKDYAVTFSRKDGEYRSTVHINPNDLSQPIKAEFKKKEVKNFFSNNSETSQILINAVKSIGCKIRKADGGILYEAKFIQWKKDEFKMISQTVVTASYGMRIYFEEEVYATEQDAENRLKNFKKVSPEIEAEMKACDKCYTIFDFREAFRRGKKVYFVSVPAYGSWLNGDVTEYRKKLERQIKK